MYVYNLRSYHFSIRIKIVKDEMPIEIYGLNQLMPPKVSKSIKKIQIIYL